jgi:hypothetical protein
MESLIKNSSSVGVKFEAEFLMSISCVYYLFSMVTCLRAEMHYCMQAWNVQPFKALANR